jgi:hypothetical protein
MVVADESVAVVTPRSADSVRFDRDDQSATIRAARGRSGGVG